MADYTTKFAIWIPLYTEDEKVWWKDADIIYIPALWGGEAPEDRDDAKKFFDKHSELWSNYEGTDVCDIYFFDDPRFPHGIAAITDDAGCASIEGTAMLIQAYLKDLEIGKPVAFMWGEDCDRHRPDGFGGGACLVTRDEIRIQSAHGLIDDWVKELTIPTTVNYHDAAPYGIGTPTEE